MRDPRDELPQNYCNKCGSNYYDKHFGLSHRTGCQTQEETPPRPLLVKIKQQTLKINFSPELIADFNSFHN